MLGGGHAGAQGREAPSGTSQHPKVIPTPPPGSLSCSPHQPPMLTQRLAASGALCPQVLGWSTHPLSPLQRQASATKPLDRHTTVPEARAAVLIHSPGEGPALGGGNLQGLCGPEAAAHDSPGSESPGLGRLTPLTHRAQPHSHWPGPQRVQLPLPAPTWPQGPPSVTSTVQVPGSPRRDAPQSPSQVWQAAMGQSGFGRHGGGTPYTEAGPGGWGRTSSQSCVSWAARLAPLYSRCPMAVGTSSKRLCRDLRPPRDGT